MEPGEAVEVLKLGFVFPVREEEMKEMFLHHGRPGKDTEFRGRM